MELRRFGSTDLMVSEIGFGCARLGGVFQSVSQADMLSALRRALGAGINFFDTSDMYCQGESEALLGRVFRGQRERVIIASKVGYCLPTRRKLVSKVKPLLRPVIRRLGISRRALPSGASGALTQNFTPAYIAEAIEGSLRRLRTDYLDLYQLHSPPPDVLESGDFLAPLEKLQREGKIRYFGVSCETTTDVLTCLRYPAISSLQLRLSLLDQTALETAVPLARERGIGLIARECFAGGLLAKPIDAPELDTFIPDETEREAKRSEMRGYVGLATQSGRTLPELALQFVRAIEGISVTLLGMRTETQLDDNLRLLAGTPLKPDELALLRARATSHAGHN